MLTSKQKQYLKALAVKLPAVVQIIGRNCVLFKQKEKKSHYELP